MKNRSITVSTTLLGISLTFSQCSISVNAQDVQSTEAAVTNSTPSTNIAGDLKIAAGSCVSLI